MKVAPEPERNVTIEDFDPEISRLVVTEIQRQKTSIDMIASSNIPIPNINELGVVLGNKSSPGNIGGWFFNGDYIIDEVEKICHKWALAAFDLDPTKWHVNV
jgi:glycine hydroxymethyltransferase